MPRKMNKKEKEDFRKQRAAKKERIIRKLSETIAESKEMESNVAQDLVDKAETSYTKEFLLSLTDTERRQLLLIDEALKRLGPRRFGRCPDPPDDPGERGVCRVCLAKLSPRGGPSCPHCGRFHEGEGEDHLCSRCLERAPAFSIHRSCGAYGGAPQGNNPL